ncbi:AimR family lysis-lysogeny pheromone receptor [Shouchella clausii]|uniref:AimR family lysis-lysogeny pheromone receptor n=1 Tax=Shouchella clausii TaxID=79880 RepID=UPI000794F870|nr:AimR family lysis-lysogeny pheromone receptor [Shouchella clausii]KKI87201.1 hypothetical protein WZ76_06525 [Shouchella clausii]MDO7269337.1 AimR family lysis-lysogeny pheromone receptor [Shouchella clausii]MDO7289219.1 AimR family lysis-lysogeny pheromone receptor [Shouchella clausii]PAD15235.1 hypothetical protein CHH73_16070 [Shouchella clausii]
MLEVKEKAGTLLRQKGWSDPLLNEIRMKELANSDEYSFEEVLLIAKHLMPDEYIPLMNVYAASAKKLQHVRDAFEYAASYYQLDMLERLIHTHKEDELLREWILVYELIYNFLQGKENEEQMFESARTLFAYTNNPLVRIRLEFIEFNNLYKMGIINSSKLLESRSKTLFAQLQPSFMKTVLASRLSLLLGSINLYREGDIESAERNFLAVLVNETTPDIFMCSANHGLALVMVNKENKLCAEYGQRAVMFAKRAKAAKYNEMLVSEYVPFMRNAMGEVFDLTNVKPEEQAHQYLVRGDIQRALTVINNLEDKGEMTPFLIYYKGLAQKSVPLLLDAMEGFTKNDFYMVELVKKKINQLV